MGAIALIRQLHYDADWYSQGNSETKDLALEALIENVKLPKLFDANDKLNVLRAAKLSNEFDLNFAIKGSGKEYENVRELKQFNNTLIIPVNFPKAFNVSNSQLNKKLTINQLRYWTQAPANLSILEKNGINFVIEEVPGIQKLIKWEMNRRLSNDADEGNISSIVKRDGYNWEQIKEEFMVTPYKENKEQNFNDNVLLKKAWKSGWRPDKNQFVPMEYQTEKYKDWFNDNFSGMNSIDPEKMQGSIEALSNKELSSELENYFNTPN